MKVLVPYDGSESSLDALDHAVERFSDAEIAVVHVVDRNYVETPYGQLLVGETELRERAREGAEELLDEAETAAEAAGVRVETVVLFGHPVGELLDYADEHGVDQIVIGGRGLSNAPRLLLGSVSFGIVLHADVPVTVVR